MAPPRRRRKIKSSLSNRQLPGAGSRILAQDLHYPGRVAVGDSVTFNLTLREKSATDSSVRLDCTIVSQLGETLLMGSCQVIAPTQRIAYAEFATPQVIIRATPMPLPRCWAAARAPRRLAGRGRSAAARPDHAGVGGAGGAHPGAAAGEGSKAALSAFEHLIRKPDAGAEARFGVCKRRSGRWRARLGLIPPDHNRHNRAFLRVASGRPKRCACSRI